MRYLLSILLCSFLFSQHICDILNYGDLGECDMVLGYSFNGYECAEISGCGAWGDMFDDLDECNQTCENCHIIDPNFYGPCEMILGWAWTDEQCTLISGCGYGEDAEYFYDSLEECALTCTDSVIGCTDPDSCNYNPDATIDDGSCSENFPDGECDCDGNILDECGDCNGSNDCFPVAIDGQYTLDEDNQINIYLSATDSDGDALTFSIVNPPSNGTLTLEGVSATYSPNANYNGNDSFTFMVNDGQFDSNQAIISLIVNAINDDPFTNDMQLSTLENTLLNITLDGVDIDDGDVLTYDVMTQPENGFSMTNNDGTVTYSPNIDFNGEDSFTYMANDGTLDSNIATVVINVYQEEMLGDVNDDGLVNVLDIVTMVNIVLNGGDYNLLVDLNGDEIVNVLDIVALVDIILN